MDKTKIKFMVAEFLFMLVCGLDAGVAFAAQMLERTVIGKNAGSFFASIAYEYNILLYILGWVLYVLFVFVALWFFKLKVTAPHASGKIYKTICIIIAVLMAVATGLLLIFEAFMFLGIGGHVEPRFLMYLSVIGMPVLALAGMICNVVKGEGV